MNILTSKAFLKGILFTTIFSISGFSADFDPHDKHGGKLRVMVPADGGGQKDSIRNHGAPAVNNNQVSSVNNPLLAPKRSWARTIVGVTILGGVSVLYLLNPFSARSTPKNSNFEMSDPKVSFAITQDEPYMTKSPLSPAWYDGRFSLMYAEAPQYPFSFTVPETCPNTIVWPFSESETVRTNTYPSPSAYGDSFTLTPAVKNIWELAITDSVNHMLEVHFNGTVCPVEALIENPLEETTCKSPTQQKEEVIQPLTVTDLTLTDVVLAKNKSRVLNSDTEVSWAFCVKVAGGVVLIVGTPILDLLRRYNNAVKSVNGVVNSSWRQWWPTARAHTWWYGNPEVWQEVLSSYRRTLGM